MDHTEIRCTPDPRDVTKRDLSPKPNKSRNLNLYSICVHCYTYCYLRCEERSCFISTRARIVLLLLLLFLTYPCRKFLRGCVPIRPNYKRVRNVRIAYWRWNCGVSTANARRGIPIELFLYVITGMLTHHRPM